MKKLLYHLPVLILFLGFVGTSQAQFRLGPTINFASDNLGFGLGAKADFYIQENISISPAFTIFFAEGDNVTAIDADAHYYFDVLEDLDFYGLGGLEIASGSGNTDLGLNLGAGLDFNIQDNLDTFAEAKFDIGGLDAFIVTLGVYFRMGGN
jgi:opacity protein-like surface antigen